MKKEWQSSLGAEGKNGNRAEIVASRWIQEAGLLANFPTFSGDVTLCAVVSKCLAFATAEERIEPDVGMNLSWCLFRNAFNVYHLSTVAQVQKKGQPALPVIFLCLCIVPFT